MELGLEGKVVMVAAASRGIGRACAEALHAEGARVSICGRDQAALESVGVEVAMAADVSSLDDLTRWHQTTVSVLGEVDILVTNTGGPPVARFLDLDDAKWQEGVESTLMNVVRLSRLVAPGMRLKRWGRIVHLTSLVAKQPEDELTISSTLRAGLCGLTKTMSNQLGPDGITVNAVLMGHVMTGRQEHLADLRSQQRGITREQYFDSVTEHIPLRRIGAPREVGDVVAFLCSQRASYVTGTSIQVDGGIIRATF
jgi:3-oxoacyl-[acyl-carrier protein] reductase